MLLLDTERASLQPLFDMVRSHSVGFDVELHKRTLQRGQLSLIGPESDDVAGATRLARTSTTTHRVEVAGIAALAVRTDVGVDLLCEPAHRRAERARFSPRRRGGRRRRSRRFASNAGGPSSASTSRSARSRRRPG